MLAGLMSRWIRLWRWAAESPAAISRPIRSDEFHRWTVASVEPFGQRHSLQVLHGQERDTVFLPDLVDGDDVVVLDGRSRPSLAHEPLRDSRGIRDLRPDDLQGDRSGEKTVFGQEDNAHAAFAQEPENAVVGQPAELSGGSRRAEEVDAFVAGRRTARYDHSGRQASRGRIGPGFLQVLDTGSAPGGPGLCSSIGIKRDHGSPRVHHDRPGIATRRETSNSVSRLLIRP